MRFPIFSRIWDLVTATATFAMFTSYLVVTSQTEGNNGNNQEARNYTNLLEDLDNGDEMESFVQYYRDQTVTQNSTSSFAPRETSIRGISMGETLEKLTDPNFVDRIGTLLTSDDYQHIRNIEKFTSKYTSKVLKDHGLEEPKPQAMILSQSVSFDENTTASVVQGLREILREAAQEVIDEERVVDVEPIST